MATQFVAILVVDSHFDPNRSVRLLTGVLDLSSVTDLLTIVLALLGLFFEGDDSKVAELGDILSRVAPLDLVDVWRFAAVFSTVGVGFFVLRLVLSAIVRLADLLHFITPVRRTPLEAIVLIDVLVVAVQLKTSETEIFW